MMQPIKCDGYHECFVRCAKAVLFIAAMPLMCASCVGYIFKNTGLSEELRKIGWKSPF